MTHVPKQIFFLTWKEGLIPDRYSISRRSLSSLVRRFGRHASEYEVVEYRLVERKKRKKTS
jgi:hypothetical protein